jgi:hypothetical protein
LIAGLSIDHSCRVLTCKSMETNERDKNFKAVFVCGVYYSTIIFFVNNSLPEATFMIYKPLANPSVEMV